MLNTTLFSDTALYNRLGQGVNLGVHYAQHQGRDYLFVLAPMQQASSFVGKNAEPFAFQLREQYQLDSRRMEMVEVRQQAERIQLYRWRFEWVGASPLSARSEEITSPILRANLLSLLAEAPSDYGYIPTASAVNA